MKFWVPFLCCVSCAWAGYIPEWVYWCTGTVTPTVSAVVRGADEAWKEHQKQEEEVRQQRVRRQIEVWENAHAQLESLNNYYQEKTAFCSECKSLLKELIRAQQAELKNNIELVTKDQQQLFTREIAVQGGIIHLQEEALSHLGKCKKCKSECTRFSVEKELAEEKQRRLHYKDCVQAWNKAGYQNLSEKEKEEAFQRRLDIAVKISTFISNLASAMK